MRVAVFSTKEYDRQYLREAVANGASGPHDDQHDQHGRHELTFLDVRLGHETAPLAAGYEAVCLFVNDFNAPAISVYRRLGFQHRADWDSAFYAKTC